MFRRNGLVPSGMIMTGGSGSSSGDSDFEIVAMESAQPHIYDRSPHNGEYFLHHNGREPNKDKAHAKL